MTASVYILWGIIPVCTCTYIKSYRFAPCICILGVVGLFPECTCILWGIGLISVSTSIFRGVNLISVIIPVCTCTYTKNYRFAPCTCMIRVIGLVPHGCTCILRGVGLVPVRGNVIHLGLGPREEDFGHILTIQSHHDLFHHTQVKPLKLKLSDKTTISLKHEKQFSVPFVSFCLKR